MGMGTVGDRKITLTSATCELHRQAVSAKLGAICRFFIMVSGLAM